MRCVPRQAHHKGAAALPPSCSLLPGPSPLHGRRTQVRWSPYRPTLLAVSTAQYYGIVGNGRLYVLDCDPNSTMCTPVAMYARTAVPIHRLPLHLAARPLPHRRRRHRARSPRGARGAAGSSHRMVSTTLRGRR
jgi:hypothetical protein